MQVHKETIVNLTEKLYPETYADNNTSGNKDATEGMDVKTGSYSSINGSSYPIFGRVKKENISMDYWEKEDLITKDDLEKIKSEMSEDEDKFHNLDVTQLHEEVDFKNESDASVASMKVQKSVSEETILGLQHNMEEKLITDKKLKCRLCIFKTSTKLELEEHMLKHQETSSSFKFNFCIYCNKSFNNKASLDEHILRNHPNFIRSVVTSKVYKCRICIFRTIDRVRLDKHMSKHPEAKSSYKQLGTCVHCTAAFKNQKKLDNHILEKHPKFVESISSIIYNCETCTYKTTLQQDFYGHILQHPDRNSTHVFECRMCPYKTPVRDRFVAHMRRQHHEASFL